MSESTRPSRVRVFADQTPGPHRTDSDDICTGRDAIFDSCQCLAGGAR